MHELAVVAEIAEWTQQGVHLIDDTGGVDVFSSSHGSVPAAMESFMDRADGEVQSLHIPEIETKTADSDLYVPAGAGNISVTDEETRERNTARSAPLSSDLAGLRVVPATAEFFVIDDHKHVL